MDNRTMSKSTNHFNNPKEYEDNSSLQTSFGIEMIKWAKFQVGERVLDVGCGDGRLTKLMAEKVGENGVVIAIDISMEMLNYAKARYNQNNLGFIHMNAEEIIFQRQFDVVIALNSIHWIKNLEKAFNGIKSALVENGRAIMLIPVRNEMDKIIDMMTMSSKWQPYFKNFVYERNFPNVSEYQQVINKLEFDVQIFEEKSMSHTFVNKLSMIHFLKACLPHAKCLNDEQCQEFFGDIVDAYCSLTEQKNMNNPIIFSLPELCIHIRKIPYELNNKKGVYVSNNPFISFKMSNHPTPVEPTINTEKNIIKSKL